MNDSVPAPAEKKSPRKIYLIGSLAFVLIAVIAACLYLFVFSGNDPEAEQKKAEIEDVVLPPAYVEVPPLMVNLNNASGTRYLRLRLQLELVSQTDVPAVEAAMPRIVDGLQTYLRQLSADDLRGAAGTQRLQTELHGLVSSIDHHLNVKDILIQEMLIQ